MLLLRLLVLPIFLLRLPDGIPLLGLGSSVLRVLPDELNVSDAVVVVAGRLGYDDRGRWGAAPRGDRHRQVVDELAFDEPGQKHVPERLGGSLGKLLVDHLEADFRIGQAAFFPLRAAAAVRGQKFYPRRTSSLGHI